MVEEKKTKKAKEAAKEPERQPREVRNFSKQQARLRFSEFMTKKGIRQELWGGFRVWLFQHGRKQDHMRPEGDWENDLQLHLGD